MTRPLRVSTRGSPLALAQTEEVLAQLRERHPDVKIEPVVIKTHGDEAEPRDREATSDGKRAFTKRIEDALLEGRVDFAIHSLKDLPADTTESLKVAAIPPRADPRDVFVANEGISMERLPAKTRVGTSSLRRRAQVLARWPDARVEELHGNVETRLRRLDSKDFDAIVIAAAGVRRLRIRRPFETLPPEIMIPAPGQGALAVQVRADDTRLTQFLSSIEDPPSRIATDAERRLSLRIGGGCNVPLGALATLERGALNLRAVVASPDARRVVRSTSQGPRDTWEEIVEDVARDLLDGGARKILNGVA